MTETQSKTKQIATRNQQIINDRLQNDLTTPELEAKYHLSTYKILEILKADTKAAETIKQGRPLKYKTVEELQTAINNYFESCWEQTPLTDKSGHAVLDDNNKPIFTNTQTQPYTVTDLAISIGLSRRQLIEYQDNDPGFNNAISRAKEKCQGYTERQLFLLKSSRGAEFSLKNNWGWKDRQEIEHVGGGQQVNIAFITDRTRQRLADLEAENAELKRRLLEYEPAQDTVLIEHG